ncbi:MAG: DUF1294 domain-containing protein [Bradymonadia bacterium]
MSLWMVVAGVYLVMSVVSFVMYAWDKRAATKGHRRTPEKTLHLVDLLGGWPGGWLAMRTVRHKTQKRSFRMVFWATVALHVLGWGGVIWWMST